MPGKLVGPTSGYVDRMKGKGMCSSSFLQQIGSSSALSAGGGNVFSQIVAAGVGNGADQTDDTLMTCSLPANLFDLPGRCITIQAWGTTTAAAVTKVLQFKFGAAALQALLSGASGATGGGAWQFNVQIYKVSANVQQLVYQADATGTAVSFFGGGVATRGLFNSTGSEVDTAAIPLVITGKSTGAATANTVLCNGLIVDAYN